MAIRRMNKRDGKEIQGEGMRKRYKSDKGKVEMG
jgi:hypothetical protein